MMKRDNYNSNAIIYNILIVALVMAVFCGFFVVYPKVTQNTGTTENSETTKGYELVKCLYEFEDVSELDESRKETLKNLVTDNVYDELTFDNEGRMLNTYLRLKGDPVTVEIVRDKEGVVLYRLHTDKISDDRLFELVYDLDDKGKISYVREMECIDFVTTID